MLKGNIDAFETMYKEGWGNRYPSDGLVSYYYNIIRPNLVSNLTTPLSVLDFGCGLGANSEFFYNLGYDVYGIESSRSAVRQIEKSRRFPQNHFVCCNILDENTSLSKVFSKRFDIIISLAVFVLFSDEDIQDVTRQFYDSMNDDGILYVSISTPNRSFVEDKNVDGIQTTDKDGSVHERLSLNFVKNKGEMEYYFGQYFDAIAVLRTMIEDLHGENETIHYFGKKRNNRVSF